jgi:hypothetical protein
MVALTSSGRRPLRVSRERGASRRRIPCRGRLSVFFDRVPAGVASAQLRVRRPASSRRRGSCHLNSLGEH